MEFSVCILCSHSDLEVDKWVPSMGNKLCPKNKEKTNEKRQRNTYTFLIDINSKWYKKL